MRWLAGRVGAFDVKKLVRYALFSAPGAMEWLDPTGVSQFGKFLCEFEKPAADGLAGVSFCWAEPDSCDSGPVFVGRGCVFAKAGTFRWKVGVSLRCMPCLRRSPIKLIKH